MAKARPEGTREAVDERGGVGDCTALRFMLVHQEVSVQMQVQIDTMTRICAYVLINRTNYRWKYQLKLLLQ